MKILIADDTASDRIVLKSYLKQLGHEVIDVADGASAIEAYREHRETLDLLILDVMMPLVNGYQAARELRTLMAEDWVPILFLSGLTEDEDLATGIDAGGDDYLFKPVNKVILEAKMNAMYRIAILRQKLSESNKQLERLVNVDGLTGAANRRYLDTYLENEMLRARRGHYPLSICMVDVDWFKSFNDTYGHLAGDECLRQIVDAMSRYARRPTDLVARYGGEEFCCVFSETDLEVAAALAEQMRAAIEGSEIGPRVTSEAHPVTVSIGVSAIIPDMNSSVEALIHQADQALYRAKELGRNRVQLMLD